MLGPRAQAIQRVAPRVGGLISSTILTLEIVPAIYSLWRWRQVEWVKGPGPSKETWDELSAWFGGLGNHGRPEIAFRSRPSLHVAHAFTEPAVTTAAQSCLLLEVHDGRAPILC